jgi:hypothetical protein
MEHARSKWRQLPGLAIFLLLLLLPTPSSATGCTYESCWVCESSFRGEDCAWANGSDGRLCCRVYWEFVVSYCRAYDYYCYGVIVRDV